MREHKPFSKWLILLPSCLFQFGARQYIIFKDSVPFDVLCIFSAVAVADTFLTAQLHALFSFTTVSGF